MSEFAAKLEAPQTSTGGLARQRLSSLKARWGVVDQDWKRAELVQVKAMDYVETWAKVDGGTDPWFELRERRKI